MSIKIEEITGLFPSTERDIIVNAYQIACDSLKDITRGNNHPFIEHPLGVAKIVAEEIGLMADAVAAVFIHETLRFNEDLLQEVSKKFPKDIIDIAVSLNKISAIKPKDTRLEAENYRRLIVSYSLDPRVALIKLADRLEIVRNIHILPKTSQESKMTETILLYVPLAHQLGLYKLKSELEDLFLRFSESEQYRSINTKFKLTEKERNRIVSDFIIPLREKLDKEGIKYELKARTKSAYSIWKKMQTQGIPFEKIYDLFAIRFIIDAPKEREEEHKLCWKVYSLVTEEYIPDISRLRDWITNPKTNGYESLHITVQNKKGVTLEVQIRTRRMDDAAESGVAAHWSYKGVSRINALDGWLASVKGMLESRDKISYKQISENVIHDIFVFTPNGDLRRLPPDACVLDFAFDIHTNLGIKCTGGKIEGKVVSIREKLKTGDIVEIISNKNQKPSQDWLSFVVTSKAKSKIRQKLNEEELKKAGEGKELLDRRLKNWKLEINDELLHELCKKYKYKTINEFYAALSEKKIDIIDIKGFISDFHIQASGKELQEVKQSPQGKYKEDNQSDYLIIDNKLRNVEFKMAKCCNPVFGDDVFGFVTIKDGIKIHRTSCPNAARLFENYSYRIQKVRWKADNNTKGFQATIKIICDDENYISQYIINTANSFGLSLRNLRVEERSNKREGVFNIFVKLSIGNNNQLDKIMSALRKARGVNTVLRVPNDQA